MTYSGGESSCRGQSPDRRSILPGQSVGFIGRQAGRPASRAGGATTHGSHKGRRAGAETGGEDTQGRPDCGTVGIPPLKSKRTLGILDGGRGGAVDRARRRRGITGVDKGGA